MRKKRKRTERNAPYSSWLLGEEVGCLMGMWCKQIGFFKDEPGKFLVGNLEMFAQCRSQERERSKRQRHTALNIRTFWESSEVLRCMWCNETDSIWKGGILACLIFERRLQDYPLTWVILRARTFSQILIVPGVWSCCRSVEKGQNVCELQNNRNEDEHKERWGARNMPAQWGKSSYGVNKVPTENKENEGE